MIGTRRLLLLLLAYGTGLIATAGLVVSYVQRNDLEPWAAIVLLLVTTLIGIGATAWYVGEERRDEDLVLAAKGALPMPAWWWAVGAIGLVDVIGGAAVSGWVAVLGFVLVGLALLG